MTDFKDINEMSEDELLDFQATDPRGYAANLVKQAEHNIKQGQEAAEQEAAVMATFEQYADDNPDFLEKWESGEIREYMEANPGHNPLSAHLILSASKAEQEVQGAGKKDDPKTETNDKVSTSDPRLADPKKYGGVTSVITQRLSERQSSMESREEIIDDGELVSTVLGQGKGE